MKLCIDCKWCQITAHNSEFSRCAHPQSYDTSALLVNGRSAEAYCKIERNQGKCGRDGKHFEPASPKTKPLGWFQRLCKAAAVAK